MNDANTPVPSKPKEPNSNAGDTEKGNSSMNLAQTINEERRNKKRRVVESSDEDSDEENESERTNVRQESGATKTTATENQASGADEPLVTKKAIVSKAVGHTRKLSEEATRRSTRQRKGVEKMGGVMIHRIEYKWAKEEKGPGRVLAIMLKNSS